MLIFVQVCRIIDKSLVSLWSIGSDRTNESNEINKKEAWRIWRRGSEDKRFWISWRHQRFWKSSEDGRLKNFKCCSNDEWITPIILEYWENKTTAISNGLEGIGCLFSWERWKRTFVQNIVYSHYLHYSVFVSASTRTTVVPETVFL